MISKTFKLFCITAAITGCMSIPAFAAETKEEYRAEAALITADLDAVETQLDTLRTANKIVSDKYKAICAERKESGAASISTDIREQIKELRKESAQYRISKDEVSSKELRTSIRESMKNSDYDAALNSLSQLLESRKSRLDNLTKTNELMQQIDALLES